MQSHKTNECRFLGQSKCCICERFGHRTEDCYLRRAKELKHKREPKDDKADRKGKKPAGKQKREEVNEGEEMDKKDDDEHIMFTVEKSESLNIVFDSSEKGQVFNFDDPNVNNSSEIDTHLIFYNWLTDSAMTSHVCNHHEAL
jgi:hypothetical protein